MVILLNNIARIKNEQGHYQEAIRSGNNALAISVEIDYLEGQRNASDNLYIAYKSLDNARKALEYYERISIITDSLRAEETNRRLQQLEFAKQMVADSLQQEEEKLRMQMAHEAEVRKKNRARNIFIIAASFLLLIALGILRRIIYIRKAKKAIEYEKNRSENLLLNILPHEIAEELKEKGRADARRFENVSILFTDFKNFTKISEQLSAGELVNRINHCFERFDSICNKYDVEKIKTIGDAYMAAGGLPVPADDAAKKTVRAGLEMAAYINRQIKPENDPDELCFEMRVGINTGPVVAGIVGVTKFQYDIWGDAVNTASRMESAGEPGKVNISQFTYEMIKDDPDFNFHPRGEIQVKGKGKVNMWFVELSDS
jgi:class 3 adenylate cyclase